MRKTINTLVYLLLVVFVVVCLVQFTKLNEQAGEFTFVKQTYEQRIAEVRDSLATTDDQNEILLGQVEAQKANIQNLYQRIAAITQAWQEPVFLPPDEVVEVFDSLTGNYPQSSIVDGSVLTSIERVREANSLIRSVYFISEESFVKSLIIASQDSIITNLESVNLNKGIQVQQLERIISMKDSQLIEYEKIISDCTRKRKTDQYIKGGLIVIALFGLVF